VLYVGLPFLYKGAVVRGARYAVGVWEHASTNALAAFDIHGNGLKQFVRANMLDWRMAHLLFLLLTIQGLDGGVQRMLL
jgi:hypothetical protein